MEEEKVTDSMRLLCAVSDTKGLLFEYGGMKLNLGAKRHISN